MTDEPVNIKISFPAEFPWQHVVLEGDEECRLDGTAQASASKVASEEPSNAPAKPAHDG